MSVGGPTLTGSGAGRTAVMTAWWGWGVCRGPYLDGLGRRTDGCDDGPVVALLAVGTGDHLAHADGRLLHPVLEAQRGAVGHPDREGQPAYRTRDT